VFYRRVDDHLSLKLISVRDADAYFAVVDRNRDDLARWFGWVAATNTPADLHDFLTRTGAAWGELTELNTLILFDGEIIGSIGLHKIDRESRSCEVGYWLDAARRGHGHMTACVRDIEKLAFDDLGLNRVAIHADAANERSRAVAERLGYHLDGVLRGKLVGADGTPRDEVVYSLLRDEWDARA
jgi:ribosomal-protein-serine acetyltransferase